MAFQQLYYTSCEHGLSGYGGYQFNAVTPGVSPAVMREVEDRTIYEPPGWLLANPEPGQPEAYPVAFCYGISEATGAAIAAQVVFAGNDHSGRPGNYFVHALVTDDPEQDFGPLLPAELWGAGLWQRSPAAGTELPELPGPPPPGSIDRPATQLFLDTHSNAAGVLPQLLTAVGRAMAGDRPVLLASQDSTENAWWIAAVSYLLGERLARRMTFTTYSHRPDYAPYHLTGILRDEALPSGMAASFQLFDLTAGQAPVEDQAHPLAVLLASTGVMATPGLWQRAAAFATGSEETLDDWLAPVTAAAGLLGRPLSPGQTDEVARWLLRTAGSLPPQLADAGLSVALSQPDQALTEDRLLDLLGLARQLPATGQAARLELLLAKRAIARLSSGEPARPIPLTGPAAAAARAGAGQVLAAAPPAVALALLEWAAASQLEISDTWLEHYGQTCLDPGAPQPQLATLLRQSPAVRRGLLARLAGEPPEAAQALFGGTSGTLIERDDLAPYPGLTELWLIQAAVQGRIAPVRAFDEIADIRAQDGRARMDAELLHRLWPGGCPPDQIAELLGAVTGPPEPDVLAWFAAQISVAAARGQLDGRSLRLARALADHPILPLLPAADQHVMRNAAIVEPLLRKARSTGPRGAVDVFADLFAAYVVVDGESRALLDRELPRLLAEAEPLGRALRNCPEHLAPLVRDELFSRLSQDQADIWLARRVFLALVSPDVRGQPAIAASLTAAFEAVRDWRRADLSALGHALTRDRMTTQFQAWRAEQRTGLARRVFGAGPGAPGKRPPGDG